MTDIRKESSFMNNTYTVMIDGIYNTKMARSMALRKCAHEDPRLHCEFMDHVRDTLHTISTDEYSRKVAEFIREKGLRIISEKPVARTKNDRYVVDVCFTIAW